MSATDCQICPANDFEVSRRFYGDDEAAVAFLRQHGLLPRQVICPRCNTNCVLNGAMWRCYRTSRIPRTSRRRRCGFSVSDRKGTFIERSHVPAWKIVLFISRWITKSWNHIDVKGGLSISKNTSIEWRSFCSEVAFDWLTKQQPIGGQGETVEIDETLISHAKDQMGRPLSQIWLFGGIERSTKRLFVVPLNGVEDRRDSRTLIPLIRKYIHVGTTIMSNSCPAYQGLGDYGYTHHTTNHSENSVDPETPEIHTQTIKRLWRDVKGSIKIPRMRAEYLGHYIARYFLIRSSPYPLHTFLDCVSRLYSPGSERQARPGPSETLLVTSESGEETDVESNELSP